MESTRIILKVVAGVVPGEPMAGYTKQFTITTEQWQQPDGLAVMQV